MLTASLFIILGLLMVFFPQLLSFILATILLISGTSIAYFKYEHYQSNRKRDSSALNGIKWIRFVRVFS